MTNQEYIQAAIRTESDDFNIENRRITHAIMGCVTESGEMLDNLKKAMFYSRRLDIVNLKEEIGDIFWYLAILCDEIGVSFEEIQEKNIAKLKARYPEQFTNELANNRDLDSERKVLES